MVNPIAADARPTGEALMVSATATPSGLSLRAYDYDPSSGWSAQGQTVGMTTTGISSVLFTARLALGATGEAVLVVGKANNRDSDLFWRDTGAQTWQQATFPGAQLPWDAAASPGGGFVVVATPGGNQLVVIGKRPGSSGWSPAVPTSQIGATPAGLFGRARVAPATQDRFLLVAEVFADQMSSVEGALIRT